MIGKRIGTYEITAKLGEGGMGEVYRATDSQLRRDVAIKVLPAAFSADEERLARFEREAQLLAQLNHPNIAHIYGLEASGETRALVMELVEGPTLAERLAHGALPLAEALASARQIAEALEAAHEKGIIHRDLKPQNIKASADGRVKVLDFGLAKAMEPTGAEVAHSPALMNSPTLSAAHGTALGVILGTAAYMAPEQARGGSVDKRADIWAFGVVLYEMLVGERLFAEGSVVDTLSAVVRKEIDLGRLPEATPPAIVRLVRWCLERNPTNRLHDIADARLVIDDALAGRSEWGAGARAPGARSASGRERIWIASAVLFALLAAGLGLRPLLFRSATSAPRPVRFSVSAPERQRFTSPENGGAVALSPDGRNLLFVATDEERVARLWLRPLDSVELRSLPGTEGASYPFWSPDSRFVAYFAGRDLKKVGLAGLPPQRICEVGSGRGGSWGANDTIVFAVAGQPLLKVPAAGGTPTPVTTLEAARGETSHRFPSFLADGDRFVFLAKSQKEGDGVFVASLAGEGGSRHLLSAAHNAVFAPPGFLLYPQGRALLAQAFDADRSALIGEPKLIATEVTLSTLSRGYGSFSAASGGVLAYQSGDRASKDPVQLRWFDRTGRQVGVVGPESSGFRDPALSPDGKRIAVNKEGEESGLWQILLVDTERGSSTRLTFDTSQNWLPVWSPDGRRIAYSCDQGGTVGKICARAAGGSGEVEVLLAPEQIRRLAGPSADGLIAMSGLLPDDWSADGRFLVLESVISTGNRDLLALPLAPSGEPFMLVATAADEGQGQLSPDGKWLAYVSNESGRYEIYVQPFDGGGKWQVSTEGATQPRWRRDGRELFFLSSDQKIMATEIRSSASDFEAGPPQALFQARVGGALAVGTDEFVPSPDGQRFLISTLLEEPGTTSPIQVILDWTAELEKP